MMFSQQQQQQRQRQFFFLSQFMIFLLLLTPPSFSFMITRERITTIPFSHTSRKNWSFRRHQFSLNGRKTTKLRMTTKENKDKDTPTTTTTTAASEKLQEALRLKEQANAAREKAQEMEKTYTKQKIQTLEAKLEEAAARKRTNPSSSSSAVTMAPLDQQALQEQIDSLKNFLKNNGTRTAMKSAAPPTATQEEEKHTINKNNSTKTSEENKMISRLESIINEISIFMVDNVDNIFLDISNGTRKNEVSNLAGKLKGLLKDVKSGNKNSDEKKEILELLLKGLDGILNDILEDAKSGNITSDAKQKIVGMLSLVEEEKHNIHKNEENQMISDLESIINVCDNGHCTIVRSTWYGKNKVMEKNEMSNVAEELKGLLKYVKSGNMTNDGKKEILEFLSRDGFSEYLSRTDDGLAPTATQEEEKHNIHKNSSTETSEENQLNMLWNGLLKGVKSGPLTPTLTSYEEKKILELSSLDGIVNISGTDDGLGMLKQDQTELFRERYPLLMEEGLTYKVSESDVQQFVDNVMLQITDTFKMTARPREISNNYIIVGKPVGDAIEDGNILLSRLDEEVANIIKSSSFSSSSNSSAIAAVIDNLQYYYIRDPQAYFDLEEKGEVAMADMILPNGIQPGENPVEFVQALMSNFQNIESTALLVTQKEMKQFVFDEEQTWEEQVGGELDYIDGANSDNFLSLLALFATANFAADCYNKNIFYGFTSPIFLGLVALTFVKEFGHFIAAARNKLEVSFPPRLIPSFDTGFVAATNRLKTPAKDNKQIFDYASAGPLLGITASWIMLVYGLLQTARVVKPEEIAALPHIPLQFLQLSLLTSSTIQTFVGTDVLLSLDPTTAVNTVPVNPLVLAAHIGLLTNGLALLPVGKDSDGRRMLMSAFSRTSVLTLAIVPIMVLGLIAQGVYNWETSSFIFAYLLLQRSPKDIRSCDLPPRNDIDPAGPTRQLLLGIYTTLAIVVLSPSF